MCDFNSTALPTVRITSRKYSSLISEKMGKEMTSDRFFPLITIASCLEQQQQKELIKSRFRTYQSNVFWVLFAHIIRISTVVQGVIRYNVQTLIICTQKRCSIERVIMNESKKREMSHSTISSTD